MKNLGGGIEAVMTCIFEGSIDNHPASSEVVFVSGFSFSTRVKRPSLLPHVLLCTALCIQVKLVLR